MKANRILDHTGQPARMHHAPNVPGRTIRARFDSQFTTDENRRHWSLADGLSADALASPLVRRTLRNRSRYEYHNNGYYQGLVETVADYTIGDGPRLQMQTKSKRLNAEIEKRWEEWCLEVRYAETLKLMRMSRMYSGESVTLLRTNPLLDNAVKLDAFQVECDQLSSPLLGVFPANYPDQYFDGIVLSRWGRPVEYQILRQHPGALGAFVLMGTEFDRWPARYVLHDYRRIRPGQQRGVPETIPVLPLFAQLRRYTLAVLGAAETAADYAVVAETDAAPDDDDADPINPWDTFELRARMGVTLPPGYSLNQMKAEQPTTTYEMFVNAILREIGRCANTPVMFVTLDAQMANMSSAYIVTQPFAKSVKRDRKHNYEPMLNRTLDEWLTEAIRIDGLLPGEIPDEFPHTWRWPRIGEHADPAKRAAANEANLASGVSSIPHICAEDGYDWEEVQDSQAKALGISIDEYRQLLRDKLYANKAAAGAPNDKKSDSAEDEEQDDTADEDSADE